MDTYIEDWRAIAQEWLVSEDEVITTAVYALSVLPEYPGCTLVRMVILMDAKAPMLIAMKNGSPYLKFPIW